MSVAERTPLAVESIQEMDFAAMITMMARKKEKALQDEKEFLNALADLNRLLDLRYPTGSKKRSSIIQLVNEAVVDILTSLPLFGEKRAPKAASSRNQSSGQQAGDGHSLLLVHVSRSKLSGPPAGCSRLAIDAAGFATEGDESLARAVVDALALGWKHLLLFGLKGHRFIGCGLAQNAGSGADFRVDVYGSSGDYLASGLDGGEIFVHGSAQDQVGNILKSGKLVIAGDIGQAFMYAAKGGEVYVLGNAAGRPLINAVGSPRVVINGTALDYLAESFMAGEPTQGGGFVVLNGVEYDLQGHLHEKPTPYPGGNLFSLASGGAVYIRDPHHRVEPNQSNGGRFSKLSPQDWGVVRPLLEENERLFGIPIEQLLTVDGREKDPAEVYRKVEPISLKALKA